MLCHQICTEQQNVDQSKLFNTKILSQSLINQKLLYYNVKNVMQLDLYKKEQIKIVQSCNSVSVFAQSKVNTLKRWKCYLNRLVPSKNTRQIKIVQCQNCISVFVQSVVNILQCWKYYAIRLVLILATKRDKSKLFSTEIPSQSLFNQRLLY